MAQIFNHTYYFHINITCTVPTSITCTVPTSITCNLVDGNNPDKYAKTVTLIATTTKITYHS